MSSKAMRFSHVVRFVSRQLNMKELEMPGRLKSRNKVYHALKRKSKETIEIIHIRKSSYRCFSSLLYHKEPRLKLKTFQTIFFVSNQKQGSALVEKTQLSRNSHKTIVSPSEKMR